MKQNNYYLSISKRVIDVCLCGEMVYVFAAGVANYCFVLHFSYAKQNARKRLY